MKIIVVHGDYIQKSIERIQKFIDVAKKRGWRIERLGEVENQNFTEQLSGISLFKEDRLYLLEKPTLVKKSDLKWLKQNYKDIPGNLVVFHFGQLSKTALSNFPKPDKEELYKLPKTIWNFLDSFHPGNFKRSINLFHEILKKETPEFILALLAGHLRDIYIVKKDKSILNYPGWRIRKLSIQAEMFEESQLIFLIAELSNADYLSKTTSSDLVSLLDLIIASKIK